MKTKYFLFIMMIAIGCSHEKTRETLDFTESWKFRLGDDAQAALPEFNNQFLTLKSET